MFFVRVLVFLNGIRMFSSKSINVEAILVVLVVYLSYSCDICLNGWHCLIMCLAALHISFNNTKRWCSFLLWWILGVLSSLTCLHLGMFHMVSVWILTDWMCAVMSIKAWLLQSITLQCTIEMNCAWIDKAIYPPLYCWIRCIAMTLCLADSTIYWWGRVMLQLNSIGLENHNSFLSGLWCFDLLLFYFDFKVYLVDLILLCNFL